MQHFIGQVIYRYDPHPSHNWSNGLYVVVKIDNNNLHLCRITKEGNATISDFVNKYSVAVTSIEGNPNNFPTKLTYEVDLSLVP